MPAEHGAPPTSERLLRAKVDAITEQMREVRWALRGAGMDLQVLTAKDTRPEVAVRLLSAALATAQRLADLDTEYLAVVAQLRDTFDISDDGT